MSNRQRCAERVAIVTGASRGIGLAIARQIVDEGGRVTITGRSRDALEQAAEELGGPDRVLAVPGKADDREHQAEAVDRTISAFGSVDMLVNNAAINPAMGNLLDIDLGAIRKIFDVNVVAVVSWIKHVHDAWMGQHGGSVVNVASVAGLLPAEGIGAYGASKAAVRHLTMQLAQELAPRIRVNAVAPAVVRTRFAVPLYEGKEASVSGRYPLGRIGDPEDVAEAVVYLTSHDASWITGQTIVLDGGLTLGGGV